MQHRVYTEHRRFRTALNRWALVVLLGLPLLMTGCDIFGTALDERAPRVEINFPLDNSIVAGKHVKISITADALGDDNYISFINVNVNGIQAGQAVWDPKTETYLFRLDSNNYEDGLYRIEAIAFDRVSARGISAPVLITIASNGDGLGPDMQIITPEQDDKVQGIVRVVTQVRPGPITFATRVDLLVDGLAVGSTNNVLGGNQFQFDWNALHETVGEHYLEIKAYSGPKSFRISEATIVTIDEDATVDNRPGSVRWKTAGFDGEVWGSVAVGFNNDLYLGTTSDTLYAFSNVGSLKWKYATLGPIRTSPLVNVSHNIFVTSEDGRLYGVSSTGAQLWPPYSTGARIRSSPAQGVDSHLFFGDSNGKLHAVNSFDGQSRAGRWPLQVSTMPIVAPPVIARDHTIIVASTDGYLYAISPDGVVLWKTAQQVGSTTGPLESILVGMALVERNLSITLPTGEIRTSTAVVVYVVSNAGYLYAIAGEDGSILWSYALTGPLRSGPVVGPDGAIYVGTSTGLTVFNPDADAFTPRLRFIFPAEDVGTPVIDANEVIHFVGRDIKSHKPKVYAINPNNTPVWEYDLNMESDGPPTISRDGALLISGQNNMLFSIETGSVGLSLGQWPMYQRNARHTGRIGIDADDG